MNSHETLPQDFASTPSSLHRSECTTDLGKFLPRRQRASRTSENRLSRPDSTRSESHDSNNSQLLYMSTSKRIKKRREIGRSLSSISNGAGRRFDGSLDEKPDDSEGTDDIISRRIIDREISEWQYVCHSGRPYWWSLESKYTRLQRIQHKVASEYDPQVGLDETDTVSKLQYDMRRRTVSDSYLADPGTVHDLAHLIAVQLLGACFTLPPESIAAVTPYYSRDEEGITTVQDTRLISSLRMHTHFRYSPSFGHQARNTSPVQTWPGRFDGPKSGSSPPLRSNTDCSTPNIRTSSPCFRRPKMQRTLHNTEGSGKRDSAEDEDEDYIKTCCNNNELDPSVRASTWYRREGVSDASHLSLTLPHIPSSSSRRRPPRTPEGSREEESVSLTSGRTPRSNYRLQPVIRSEPHHVFIQPVRELVVKRWRQFRRRLSGSLHSSLPAAAAAASEDLASGSESSASEESSPLLGSEAKARRLRAQERGDIHSSSMDSTPHYNTPRSGHLSPSSNGFAHPHLVDSQNSTPCFRPGDPLSAAASLVAAEMLHTRATSPPTPSKPSSSTTPGNISSRGYAQSPATSAQAMCNTGHAGSDVSSLPASSRLNTPPSIHSYSSSQRIGRSRRRSMLSEVCTPEDFESPRRMESNKTPFDRSVLSAMGSRLASPMEEIALAWPLGGRRNQEALSSPGPSVLPTFAESKASKVQQRPRFSRTSTSGTQVFTPSEEGVEIDGLPAGPPRDTWEVKGGRRERTYL